MQSEVQWIHAKSYIIKIEWPTFNCNNYSTNGSIQWVVGHASLMGGPPLWFCAWLHDNVLLDIEMAYIKIWTTFFGHIKITV